MSDKKSGLTRCDTVFDRWLQKIEVREGCWGWKASTRNGYGQVSAGPYVEYAHRLSFAFHNGFMPTAEWCVLHTCGNRTCTNPEHLYQGTKEDNAQDAIRHGTHISVHLKRQAAA